MKDGIFFNEEDFHRITAKSARGGVQSEFHIPRSCLNCDGESGRGRDCLGVDCPIFTAFPKETDEDQYTLDLLTDHRMLKEALLEVRTLKESLRAVRLLNLA